MERLLKHLTVAAEWLGRKIKAAHSLVSRGASVLLVLCRTHRVASLFLLLLALATVTIMATFKLGNPWPIVVAGVAAVVVVLLDGLGLVRDPESNRLGKVAVAFVFFVMLGTLQICLQVQSVIRESAEAAMREKERGESIQREQQNLASILREIQRTSLVIRPREWTVTLAFVCGIEATIEADDRSVKVIEGFLRDKRLVGRPVWFREIASSIEKTSGSRGGPARQIVKLECSGADLLFSDHLEYLDQYKELELVVPESLVEAAIYGNYTFDTGTTMWSRTLVYEKLRKSDTSIVERSRVVSIPLQTDGAR